MNIPLGLQNNVLLDITPWRCNKVAGPHRRGKANVTSKTLRPNASPRNELLREQTVFTIVVVLRHKRCVNI